MKAINVQPAHLDTRATRTVGHAPQRAQISANPHRINARANRITLAHSALSVYAMTSNIRIVEVNDSSKNSIVPVIIMIFHDIFRNRQNYELVD